MVFARNSESLRLGTADFSPQLYLVAIIHENLFEFAGLTFIVNRMQELLKKHAQKIRFLFVGGGLTLLDFGLLFIFVHFGLDEIPANFLSTGISFIVSYIVNRNYTFKGHAGNKIKQFILFILVTMFALWVLQPLVIHFILQIPLFSTMNSSIALFIAKMLATVVSLTWNYILYAKVVFRKKSV